MYEPRYRKKKKRKDKSKGRLFKRLMVATVICLAVVGAGIGTFEFLAARGEAGLRKNARTTVPDLSQSKTGQKEAASQSKYDPSIFQYNGKKYKYNDNITTLLCMGIDSRQEEFEEKEQTGDSGQADCIFLLVLNPATNEVHLIGVSRDTMVTMENYDVAGNPIGTSKNHLGLAYAYGDGMEESCQRVADTVSKLFYDLPIHGYGALLMNTIPTLNDAVGGVTVTVPEDLTYWDPALSKDAQVTLMGQQALYFVTRRDTNVAGSNNQRMERQKQYAIAYMDQAKKAIKENPTLPVTLYQELSPQMVTNIGVDNAVYLVSQIVGMSFSKDNIHMVEGETKSDGVYDEFYADDKKLLEMVLDIFYLED